MSAEYIKVKRRLIEDYLEAQIVLGEISKEDAQKKYVEALEKLKKMSPDEHQNQFLKSL